MGITVAILGRPNVGKSTLFNRLIGRRLAIVDDTPGVTRDRREGEGRIADLSFRLIDTAGLEDAAKESLAGRMRAQTEKAVAEADVAMLVVDAREGVTPIDRHFAQWLRRTGKPVILIANKAEGRAGVPGIGEAYALGLGEPVALSAEHGEGLGDLYDRLAPFDRREKVEPGPEYEPWPDEIAPVEDGAAAEALDKPLQLAIVGRPNVGKSTLVNRLLGEDRLLTGPEAGITRDAITIERVWKGRRLRLVDTAGMRRKPRIEEKLEHLSVADTLRAIRFAEVVVLVIDALQPLERQDLAIARLIADEGRAIILAANKWDIIDKREPTLQAIRDRMSISLPQLQGLTLVPVSGLTGAGIDTMMDRVFAAHEVWNRRIATAELNRWISAIQEHHPPPLVDGRRLRLRYVTQVNTRPPSFALFASKPGELPDAYRRYLVNSMRQDFDLPGTPIRMMLRKGKNPYAER